MTNHPITPPTELVEKWINMFEFHLDAVVLTEVAQWGADQELEACCQALRVRGTRMRCMEANQTIEHLRAARRPEPQTLNSVALQMLCTIERDAHYIPEITDTIRRALEQLPN